MPTRFSLRQAWKEVPIFFLVAPLFYIGLLLLHLLNWAGSYGEPSFLLTLAWLLLLLICSLGLVGMRRWAGIALVVLSVGGLAAWQLLPPSNPLQHAGHADFPIGLLLSAFVLFFYKRLR